MKRYLWIFAVLPFLWSCIAEDRSACPQPRGVSVRMSVCPDPMTAVTHAADEEAIRDLNLYLLDADRNVVLHRYQSSPTLRFECLPGDYLLRIAANMGRDTGDSPAWENLAVTHADDYDMLPMAYEGEVSIPSSDETIVLPTVEVQRVVAKVTYNISVAPDAGDIRLHSVQPVNLPARAQVFDPGRRAAEYTAGEIVGSSSQTLTGTFYMLPNLQGEVPSIADQRDKGPANAPADATFLRIRALRGSKVLDYCVYPGGNNTSNFDIRANTHYTLDITIRGDAEVDTRIRAYTVEVQCTPEAALSNGFLLERQPMRLTLRLGGAYEETGVEAFVELKTGDVRYFGFEGQCTAPQKLDTFGVFFMKYNYEIRLKAVKLVLEGGLSVREAGCHLGCGRSQVHLWVTLFERHGLAGLKLRHGSYSAEFKLSVLKHMHQNHLSLLETAVHFGIPGPFVIRQWERLYQNQGAEGLRRKPQRRRPAMSKSKTKKVKLKTTPHEELLKELEYLRAENAYLKKLQALVEERIVRESGKEPKPSKD